MDTNYQQGLNQLTQLYDKTLASLVPPVITTTTTKDFEPNMNKLVSPDNLSLGKDDKNAPTLATSAFLDTAASISRKTLDIPMTSKEISNLTVGQLYDNTIRTIVAIINDISVLISEKDVITGTEFRRRLFKAFTMKERRMYVGIVLIVLSFVLYFIDSSA